VEKGGQQRGLTFRGFHTKGGNFDSRERARLCPAGSMQARTVVLEHTLSWPWPGCLRGARCGRRCQQQQTRPRDAACCLHDQLCAAFSCSVVNQWG
jgi:hypothetical protein